MIELKPTYQLNSRFSKTKRLQLYLVKRQKELVLTQVIPPQLYKGAVLFPHCHQMLCSNLTPLNFYTYKFAPCFPATQCRTELHLPPSHLKVSRFPDIQSEGSDSQRCRQDSKNCHAPGTPVLEQGFPTNVHFLDESL